MAASRAATAALVQTLVASISEASGGGLRLDENLETFAVTVPDASGAFEEGLRAQLVS